MPAAPRLLAAALLLLYTGLSLAGIGALRRPGAGYASSSLATDVLFGGLALVFVVGLLRHWRWAVPALLLLTGLRIASRLGEAGAVLARTGWADATLPGPVWLLRLALLFAILCCLLVARRLGETPGAP
jgi:hypothetical protein